ncbi:MAG: hypothetical protein KAH32_05280 [Chlamydiia bacterium]|nr:hypothetical protein [Chlamydiia bacterium]
MTGLDKLTFKFAKITGSIFKHMNENRIITLGIFIVLVILKYSKDILRYTKGMLKISKEWEEDMLGDTKANKLAHPVSFSINNKL